MKATRNLVKTIEDTQLFIRENIEPSGEVIDGFISSDRKPHMIYLNGGCYNMEEVLINKSLHLIYRNAGNTDIEDMTEFYIKYPDVYESAQKKVRETVKYLIF